MKDYFNNILITGFSLLLFTITATLVRHFDVGKMFVVTALRLLILLYSIIFVEQLLQIRKYKQNSKKGLTKDERTNDN